MKRFLAVVLAAVFWGGLASAEAVVEILPENPVIAGCLSDNATHWGGVEYWMRSDCDPTRAAQPGTGTPTALRESAAQHGWWFWSDRPQLGLDGALTLLETHQGAAWHSLHEGRVVRLSGAIATGDAARLEAVFRDNDLLHCFAEGYCPFNNVLSLDSPGGDPSEALEIARFVQGHQLSVLLEPGAVCDGACAIIFLAGHTDYEGYFHPRRFADASARLGLVSPMQLLDETAPPQVEAGMMAKLDQARLSLPVLQGMHRASVAAPYRLSVPELESLGTVFHPARAADALSRAGVLSLCTGRHVAAEGQSHADLLANLELQADSFITWVRHSDFACFGARQPDGAWLYDSCDSRSPQDCALVACTDIGADPDAACASALEAADSWFMETVQNGNLGMALDETTIALRHALTRAAVPGHSGGQAKRVESWTETASVPAAYCGMLDFRDPEIARLIQRGLHQAGFDPGPVDGSVGARTLAQTRLAGLALLERHITFPDAALIQALGVDAETVEELLLCADQF